MNENRIKSCLDRAKAGGRKALVAYIVNGDPEPKYTLAAMHALVSGGADILELGIAFSDPMAEGPVIQRGHERALAHGASLSSALAVVKEFRQTDSNTPIVLMGYANPIEKMGAENFARRAQDAGVDGALTVDIPPEEAKQLNAALKQHGIENIYLLAPTTSDDRIGQICETAGGFIYYVSLKGVTGAGHIDVQSIRDKLEKIRPHTQLPVLVGFGIKDPDTAKTVGSTGDGVVVGSLFVNAMADYASLSVDEASEHLKNMIAPLRSALDSL